MLSGYRLMWIIALFDLPVVTKAERKKASKFRNYLLDLGFEMVQFSVYMKHCAGKEQAEVIQNRIKVEVPNYGNVKLLQITDKQFGAILHLGRHSKRSINTDQLVLF
jgi:CRISPR-associated protein Cas2